MQILIIGGPAFEKTNSVFDLNTYQTDIGKIYFYTKDPFEAKHYFLIDKRESTELKHLNDSKVFIKYSNDMVDIYKNSEQYNPNKRCKILN